MACTCRAGGDRSTGRQHRRTPRCWPVSGLTETTRAAHLPGLRWPVTQPDRAGAPRAGVFQWCLTGFWLGKGEPLTLAQAPCAACVGSDAASPWARTGAYTAGPCPSARPLRGQRRSGAGHALGTPAATLGSPLLLPVELRIRDPMREHQRRYSRACSALVHPRACHKRWHQAPAAGKGAAAGAMIVARVMNLPAPAPALFPALALAFFLFLLRPHVQTRILFSHPGPCRR